MTPIRPSTTALLATALALALAAPLAGPALSQGMMMRGPNLNIGVRAAPNLGTRVGPALGTRAGPALGARNGGPAAVGRAAVTTGPRVVVGGRGNAVRVDRGPRLTAAPVRTTPALTPIVPTLRYPAYPGYFAGPPDGGAPAASRLGGPQGNRPQPQAATSRRAQTSDIIVEIEPGASAAQIAGIARRHRLTRLESQDFPLIGATLVRWRIADGRPADAVLAALAADGAIRSAQRNARFVLQASQANDAAPAQYAAAKLRLAEAHALSSGASVTVAVIDSAIDARHPELAGVIAARFDALGGREEPHAHGTGIAGAIAAHARLTGSAPAARIVAIRAFGATAGGAESTSFAILKSLSFAAEQKAQIINMSFAGPQDALIGRALAAIAQRNVVLVAAAGNAGPTSPPLYPAADPNVIGVSATDSADQIFAASNQGGHVAVAAPGVDVLLPAPGNAYQMTSGTSFSAAYVSGVAALMVARNPALTPQALRAALTATARDLGAPGRDDRFGAGLADAFAAVQAAAAPLTASSERPSLAPQPDAAAPASPPMTPAAATPAPPR